MTLTTFQWLVNRQYLSIFDSIEPSRQKNQSQSLSDRPNENVFYLFQYWSITIVQNDTTLNNQHCQISRQIHRLQPTESRRTLIISFPITMIQWIKSSLFSSESDRQTDSCFLVDLIAALLGPCLVVSGLILGLGSPHTSITIIIMTRLHLIYYTRSSSSRTDLLRWQKFGW